MIFQNREHEDNYNRILQKMQSSDPYHRSAAYLMGLIGKGENEIFDFEEDAIVHNGVLAAWQTSSSKKATRLMFNLWNGWSYNEKLYLEEEKFEASQDYAVDQRLSLQAPRFSHGDKGSG